MKGTTVKSYICNSPSPMACSTILNQMGWSSAFFMFNEPNSNNTTSLIVSTNDLTTGNSLLTNEVWCSDAESLRKMESMEDGVALAFEADLDVIPTDEVWNIDEPKFDSGIKWVIQDRFWSSADVEFIVPEPINNDLLNFGPEVFGNPHVSALPIGEHMVNVNSKFLMNTLPNQGREFSTSEPGLMSIFSHAYNTPVELSWYNDNLDLHGSFTLDSCEYSEDGEHMKLEASNYGDLDMFGHITLMSNINNGFITVGDSQIVVKNGVFGDGETIYQGNEQSIAFMSMFKSLCFFYTEALEMSHDLSSLDGVIDYIIINADVDRVVANASSHMKSLNVTSLPGCLDVPISSKVILSARNRIDNGIFQDKTLMGNIINSIHLLESHGFIMESLRVASIMEALKNEEDVTDFIKNDELVLRGFMNSLARILGIDIGSEWVKEDFREQIKDLVGHLMANANAIMKIDIDSYIDMNSALLDAGTHSFIELHNVLCLHDKLKYACEVLGMDFIYPSKSEINGYIDLLMKTISESIGIPMGEYKKLLSMMMLVNRSKVENYIIMDDDIAVGSLNRIERMIESMDNYTIDTLDDDGSLFDAILDTIDTSREFVNGTEDSFIDVVAGAFGDDAIEVAVADFASKSKIKSEMNVIKALMESSDIDMEYAVESMENGGGMLPIMALVASLEGQDSLEAGALKDVVFDIMDNSFTDVTREMGFIDSPFLSYPEV